MPELMNAPGIWTALLNIMLVNILLSGDNAVVIALAASELPKKQQKSAILFGSIAAIVMRTILTIFALKLLVLPYLKIIGGILLIGIAAKLAKHENKEGAVSGSATIGAAIKTILVADLVMSLDNVLGVAAASHGNLLLLIFGLVLSLPLIAFGSGLVLKVMTRFPVVILLGAGLLGYLGGEMLFSDIAIQGWLEANLPNHELTIPGIGIQLSAAGAINAVAVILFGKLYATKKASKTKG